MATVLEETFEDALPLYEIFIKLVNETDELLNKESLKKKLEHLLFPKDGIEEVIQKFQKFKMAPGK